MMGPPGAPAASKDQDVLLSHDYDGIREYDNPMPGWWSASFVACVIFAGAYLVYFHVGHWGQLPAQQYKSELAAWNEQKGARDTAEAASVSEGAIAKNALDNTHVQHGAEVFAKTCVGCHDQEGRGKIGPNLTDQYQLHGTTRMDIFHTVHDGVPGTAMIAWGEQLPPVDLMDAVTYVTTLRGKNLPQGKEPQGQPVEAFAP